MSAQKRSLPASQHAQNTLHAAVPVRCLALAAFLLFGDFFISIQVVKELCESDAWRYTPGQKPLGNPMIASAASSTLQHLAATCREEEGYRVAWNVLQSWHILKLETWEVFFAKPCYTVILERVVQGPSQVLPCLDMWTFAVFHHSLPVIYLALLAIVAAAARASQAGYPLPGFHLPWQCIYSAMHITYVQLSMVLFNLPVSLVFRILGLRRMEPSIIFLQTLVDPLLNWPARSVLIACLRLPLWGQTTRRTAHRCLLMDALVLCVSAAGVTWEAAVFSTLSPAPPYAVPWGWSVPLQALAATMWLLAVDAWLLGCWSPVGMAGQMLRRAAGAQSSGRLASNGSPWPPRPDTQDGVSGRVPGSSQLDLDTPSTKEGSAPSSGTGKHLSPSGSAAGSGTEAARSGLASGQCPQGDGCSWLQTPVTRESARGMAPAVMHGQVAVHLPHLRPDQLPEGWLEELRARLAVTHPGLHICSVSVWEGSTHMVLECEWDAEDWEGEEEAGGEEGSAAASPISDPGNWLQACKLKFACVLQAVAEVALQVAQPPAATSTEWQVSDPQAGSRFSLPEGIVRGPDAPQLTSGLQESASNMHTLSAQVKIKVDEGTGLTLLYDWDASRKAWRLITQLPRPLDAPRAPSLTITDLYPRVFSFPGHPGIASAAGSAGALSTRVAGMADAPDLPVLSLTLRCLHADLLRARCVVRWEALSVQSARGLGRRTHGDVGVWGCHAYPSLLDLPGADVRPASEGYVKATFSLPVDPVQAPQGPSVLRVDLYDAHAHTDLLATATALYLPRAPAVLQPLHPLQRPHSSGKALEHHPSQLPGDPGAACGVRADDSHAHLGKASGPAGLDWVALADALSQAVSTRLSSSDPDVRTAPRACGQAGGLDELLAAVGRWARCAWEVQEALAPPNLAAVGDAASSEESPLNLPSAGGSPSGAASAPERQVPGAAKLPAARSVSHTTAAALAQSLQYGAWPVARVILDHALVMEAARVQQQQQLMEAEVARQVTPGQRPGHVRQLANIHGLVLVMRLLSTAAEVSKAVPRPVAGSKERDPMATRSEEGQQQEGRGVSLQGPVVAAQPSSAVGATEVLPLAIIALQAGQASTALALEQWLEAHGLSFPWLARYRLAGGQGPSGGLRILSVRPVQVACRTLGTWWALGAVAGSLMRRGGPCPTTTRATHHAVRVLRSPHWTVTSTLLAIVSVWTVMGVQSDPDTAPRATMAVVWALPYLVKGVLQVCCQVAEGSWESCARSAAYMPGIHALSGAWRCGVYVLVGCGVLRACAVGVGIRHFNEPSAVAVNIILEGCLVHLLEPMAPDMWPWLVGAEGVARAYMFMGARSCSRCPGLPAISLIDAVLRSCAVTGAIITLRRGLGHWALRQARSTRHAAARTGA